jgi:chemotaxis protein MotA
MSRTNKTLVAGATMGFGIIAGGIYLEIDGASPRVFFHPIAILIVFGGSIAGSMISLPITELKRILKRTYYVIRYPKIDFAETFESIIKVSIGVNKDVLFLEKMNSQIKNVLLRDGLALVSMGYKPDDIRRFMETKREQNQAALELCSILYFNIAKMGPAFGLLGTLVGLIILLYYNMGSGDMTKAASSMGVALTATLYGVGLANLIFQPLAEYLQYNSDRGASLDAMVIEGVMQIKERRHPIYVVQALKCFVQREDYDELEEIIRQELQTGSKIRETDRSVQREAA